jgi:transposase
MEAAQMKSIFSKVNPAIEKVFAEAENPRRILCVPLDYAKTTHTALACDGAGAQLRQPFDVYNTPDGVRFLLHIVHDLCRKHRILKHHVLFAGEDCGGFSFNFIHALASRGWTVIGLNARDAAKERENPFASTDKLDLRGIASLVINKKRGRTIGADMDEAATLRRLTHHRSSLVKARSAAAHRMHFLVDQLLPGFLDEEQSALSPFSKASLWLMSERFSPTQLHARPSNALERKLCSFPVHDAAATVCKIKALCQSVLPPPAALCEPLQPGMSSEVHAYQTLTECVHCLDLDIAKRLATTPGALLTTVPGLGIPLRSGLYAELGDPARRKPLLRRTAFAGLVDAVKQTGGPHQEGKSRARTRRGNRTAKRLLFDVALKMGQYGHPELKSDYSRRPAQGQDVRSTMGRKMLRICMHLIENCDFYLPPSMLHSHDPDALREYYLQAWTKVLIKWRNAGAINHAFAPRAPLEQWRCKLNDRFGLNLSKKSPQAWQLRHS